MHKLSLEETKTIGLDILLRINSIASQSKIQYYLAYGTLIGAARHQGFIPWDDDIDIWVPISNYERLMKLIETDRHLELLDFRKNRDFPNAFSKAMMTGTVIVDKWTGTNKAVKRGVAVDLFPLYGCPNSESFYKKIFRAQKMIGRRWSLRVGSYDSDIIRKTIVRMDALVHPDELYWNEHVFQLFSEADDSENMGCPTSPYGKKDVHHSSDFCEPVMLEFEGHSLPAPMGYDRILRDIYGNWKVMPPVAERVSNHNVSAYAIDGGVE